MRDSRGSIRSRHRARRHLRRRVPQHALHEAGSQGDDDLRGWHAKARGPPAEPGGFPRVLPPGAGDGRVSVLLRRARRRRAQRPQRHVLQ